MDTWEQTSTLSGHRGLVLALAAYGDRLISGSDDRCIRVWRMGTWECERILTGHNGGVVGVCIVQGACFCRALPCCATDGLQESQSALAFTRLCMQRSPITLVGRPSCAECYAGNLVSASNDSFIKVWNSTGVQRPFTAK